MSVTKQMFKDNANRVSWHLLASLAYSESSFNPKSRSHAGAQGLMQFMPATWESWGPDGTSPYEPEAAIAAADSYLHFLYQQTGKDWWTALIAYMWGIGHVLNKGTNHAPEIVKDRASKILFMSECLALWEALDDG